MSKIVGEPRLISRSTASTSRAARSCQPRDAAAGHPAFFPQGGCAHRHKVGRLRRWIGATRRSHPRRVRAGQGVVRPPRQELGRGERTGQLVDGLHRRERLAGDPDVLELSSRHQHPALDGADGPVERLDRGLERTPDLVEVATHHADAGVQLAAELVLISRAPRPSVVDPWAIVRSRAIRWWGCVRSHPVAGVSRHREGSVSSAAVGNDGREHHHELGAVAASAEHAAGQGVHVGAHLPHTWRRTKTFADARSGRRVQGGDTQGFP